MLRYNFKQKSRGIFQKSRAMGSEEPDYDNMLYSEREDWKDVTPIPQDDGPFPVVAISYTETCMYLTS